MGSTNGTSAANGTKPNNDVLLIHMPFTPDQKWIAKVEAKYPGFKVRWYTRPLNLDRASLPEEAAEGVTMLCSLNEPLAELPGLRYVQIASAGADLWVKTALYQDPNVVFCTANGVHPPQIAEWVIGSYLMMSHHFPTFIKHNIETPDSPVPHAKFLSQQVQDSPDLRMGILGYGAIGRQVARLAQALGMEVYAYTRREKATPESRKDDSYVVPRTGDPDGLIPSKWFHGTEKEDIDHFLAQGLDVLVVSLPLTDATRKILSKEQFEILDNTSRNGTGRKTFVSNIARGEHIDTDALVEALQTGKIKGAALDVVDPEPLPEGHVLLKMMTGEGEGGGKVFITPHVSWMSPHYFERVLAIMERNLEVLIGGEEDKGMINVIDRVNHY